MKTTIGTLLDAESMLINITSIINLSKSSDFNAHLVISQKNVVGLGNEMGIFMAVMAVMAVNP